MLGPPKPRRLDEPIAVSLEDLLPQNHFYRHLEAKLDFGFVRDWTRDLYAERGRPSIDPVVFFNQMRFEAGAMEVVSKKEGLQRDGDRLVEATGLGRAEHRGPPRVRMPSAAGPQPEAPVAGFSAVTM